MADMRSTFDRSKWPAALVVAALVVYVAAAAERLPELAWVDISWNSDAVSYQVLADAVARGMHPVYLANAPWYHVLAFDALTEALPGHRVLWLLWPAATYLGAAGVLAFTVGRLAGWWSALMTAALSLALTAPTLFPLVTQAYHGLSAVDAILLAAFLVAAVWGERNAWWLWLAAAALGAFTGLNAASDALGLVVAEVPFVVVALALVLAWRDRQALRLALAVAMVTACSAASATATVIAAQSLGLVGAQAPPRLVGPVDLTRHLQLAGGVVREELAGTWRYQIEGVPGRDELVVALVVLGIMAAAVGIVAGRLGHANRPRTAWYAAWTAMAAAAFAGLAFTETPIDLWAVRYAVVLWIAAAATLPVVMVKTADRRLAFAVLAAVVVAAHAWLLHVGTTNPPVLQQRADDMTAALAYLESTGVHHGYADYWEADSGTWVSHGAVVLRAAASCDSQGTLCAYEQANTPAWYAPQPGPAAVIVDPTLGLDRPPAREYGTPRAVKRVGHLTVYVFGRDPGPIPLRAAG